MQKPWVLKCRLNRSGEWFNLESRAPVPWDLVKLHSGGVVLADGAVLNGTLIQADTSQVNEDARNVLPAGRETNYLRVRLLRAQMQSRLGSRGGVFTDYFHSPPFCVQLDMGWSILKLVL